MSFSRYARALRLVWLAAVLFGELGVFLWSICGCKWPLIASSDSPLHVLLVADTQVPFFPKLHGWRLNPFRRVLFELNLRKSWHVATSLKPDAVVFLGDMLLNGRVAKDRQQYKSAVDKFKAVFHVADPRTEVYYVPGNNDVGLGGDRPTSRMLRSLYQDAFGALNRKFVLRNHTFIAIDSAGLVDEDYLRNGEHARFSSWSPLPNGTVSFVKQLAQQELASPVVLLSHIPLARAESAHCGPLREQGTIRRGAGPGWQSTLSRQSTEFLLDCLRPSIIFSADNRDYCDYTHTIMDSSRHRVREITLKSFSVSGHIRRPGFQLLSLVAPAVSSLSQQALAPNVPSLAEGACFLPDQSGIYAYLYAPLFVLSLLILARFQFLNLKQGQFWSKSPFLEVKTAGKMGGGDTKRRRPLCESPSALMTPSLGTEPVWTPFAPFTPVTPPVQAMRRPPSMTSAPSFDGRYRQSSVSSFSSTTTLLGGENLKEGDCQYNFELDGMYDPLPEPFSFTAAAAAAAVEEEEEWSREHKMASLSVDLESLRDVEELVDEEAVPYLKPAQDDLTDDSRSQIFRRWSASYSFVLRGRRRRIRLPLPSRSALWNLMEFLGVVDESPLRLFERRRRNRRGCGGDLVDVFWPAVVLWLVVNGLTRML